MGIWVTCAWTLFPIDGPRAPLTKPLSDLLPAALTTRRSVPLVALQAQVRRFPSPFRCHPWWFYVRHWRARDSETRSGVATRQAEGLTCERRRHEARPRGRVFHYPPPAAFCEGAPTPVRRIRRVVVARGITDAEGLGGHRRGETEEFRSRCSARSQRSHRGERQPPSLEGKKKISRSVCTLRGTLF